MAEVVSILRDVARALAYAHGQGIVHRDIKPDNVLLSAGSATVTDFGIAKAISASRTAGDVGSTALTQAGMSIGTPAYMAPEQALGDPDTDHRADLYAFGVMGYELVAGRMPFDGGTPARLLAAHIGETPPDLSGARPDCPPALASLLMSCLDKDPGKRPQSAREVARVLDSITTSGSGTVTPAILRGGPVRVGRAVAIWAGATALVALTAWAATAVIGLPDWVFPGSVGVMLAGLPVIALTAFVQRTTHRAFTATPGSVGPQGTMATLAMRASPHLSWRRTWLGGGIAVGTFAALVVGFMVLRALGIGPMASLRGTGDFGARETLMVADFTSPANDSTLGATVAEALRTALAQSPSLDVLTRPAIRDLLGLMKRPADTLVTYDLAREIATREGAKAVLDGSIERLGSSYVVSARLVSTLDGRELALFREEAASDDELLPAVGKLSREVRAKAGESLRTIRASSELERVTTASLPALRKYVEGSRIADEDGDYVRGITTVREAVRLDTSFAMAWRKLAALIGNEGTDRAAEIEAITKAFQHRDRLTEMERLLTEGFYYTRGPAYDGDRALAAYLRASELDSTSTAALNNAAVVLGDDRGEYVRAESLYRKVTELPRTFGGAFTNLLAMQIIDRRPPAALDSTLARYRKTFPDATDLWTAEVMAKIGKGDYGAADSIVAAVASNPVNQTQRYRAADYAANLAELAGRIAEARRWRAQVGETVLQVVPTAANRLNPALDTAYFEAGYGDPARARAAIQRGLARTPMREIAPASRPWQYLTWIGMLLGDAGLVREAVQGYEKDQLATAKDTIGARARNAADLAYAEGRWGDMLRNVEIADQRHVFRARLPDLLRGLAYRGLGQPDSAIARLEAYVGTGDPFMENDRYFRARVYEMLGELYDQKGDTKKAVERYGQMTELWANADPSLQPKVKAVRRRIAKLLGETG